MRMLKMMVVSLCVIAIAAGCNTMRGMGQDIEKGGAAIEKAASK